MRQFFESLNDRVDQWKEKSFVKKLNIASNILWNLVIIGFILILMLFLFVGGAGVGYFMSLVEDQDAYGKEEFEHHLYNYEEISDIYFSDEKYLGKIPSDLEREERSLDEFSDHLIHAVISTEDEYFFEHEGIVPKALLRATYQEVMDADTQTGGSTLTQQVVKNQILTNEVSFERKAKEIALALRMENFFEKEEILEAYLNIVPFGRNADGDNIAGAQSAAEGIFGIDASELNIAQAAFIAGLPKNPFGYTPFKNDGEVKENFDSAIERQHLVLRNMLENNYIDQEEYEEALDYNIKENLAAPTGSVIDKYPFLTFETQRRAARILRDQMLEEENIKLSEMESEERQQTIAEYDQKARDELALGGYNVHLTIDKSLYDAMQEATKNSNWFGPDTADGEQEEVGAILIDNETGAILSFVGGRDYNNQSYNHATQAYRQNGSTMKPLLAYGPAMEQGIVQPGTVLPDVPSTYSDGTPFGNYGDSYSGFSTVRDALKRSRNVPAVKTFQRVSHEASREALEKLGFARLHPDEPFESGAIGGLHYGATVEQNTNAFTVFGNKGKYNDSYMIEKIEKKDGEVIYEDESDATTVFSPQTTFLMTDVLRDVVKPGGTAGALPNKLQFGGDWAGKTGTTNDYHDSWFIGYNPNVTFGVWIGYDTPQAIATYYKGLSYGARTQQIWADMMNAAYQANEEALGLEDEFEQPEGIVRQTICGISGKLPSSLCSQAGLTTTDYFNEKYLPTEVDNSLRHSPYVTIYGSQYRAYSSTPSEFTQYGVAINEEYFDVDSVGEYLPDNWTNVVPDREAPSNGRAPTSVTGISFSGGTLSWHQHPDSDIVGYRIYRSNGSLARTVVGNTTTSISMPGGTYRVTAVDTMGRESSRSVQSASWTNQPAPEENNQVDQEEPFDDSNDSSVDEDSTETEDSANGEESTESNNNNSSEGNNSKNENNQGDNNNGNENNNGGNNNNEDGTNGSANNGNDNNSSAESEED